MRWQNKLITKFLLSLIVLAAFALRISKVTEIPPSLNWDEVSIGYNAYSVLKTGKDEWGKFLPIHFKSYGEYKLPVQIYASIPAVAVFGLNELGVRITPVVYGTLTVLLLYFLAKELSGKPSIGLFSALFLAISPWHIHLTRASFESSFSVFWVVIGIWFAVKGLKEKNWLLASTIPFSISIYTYNSARVFTPIFILVSLFIFRKEILKDIKKVLVSGLVFFVLMIPLILFFFSGEAASRLKLVSIMDDPGFVLRINQARGNLKLPEPLPRVVHNKLTHFTYVFSKNYLAHFTPDFLFISGASHKQHHVQGIGELYAFQAPFVLLGVYYLFSSKQKYRWLIISWIAIAFIPVSITGDSIPHALRTLIAAPAYQILTAFGLVSAYELLKNKSSLLKGVSISILALVAVFSLKGYFENYYLVYPKAYSRDWQYGYKQVVSFINDNYESYDLIVFSRHYGEPHMFTLFFLNWDPAKFQTDPNLVRFETYDWIRVLRFDKFYFPDLGDAGTRYEEVRKENKGKKILFIGKPGDFPESAPKLLTVNFLDGSRAFEIVEAK